MTDKISNTKLYIMTTNVGLVKIGVSKVVESRLETLKLVSPFEVECAAVVSVVGKSRDVYNIEKALHHKYKEKNKVFPNKFDGSTEYFHLSLDDVMKELYNFPQVAFVDKRERVVYNKEYSNQSLCLGSNTGIVGTTDKYDEFLKQHPVTTAKECASKLEISLKEAGSLLRSHEYEKFEKVLGRATPSDKQRVYSRLSRAQAKSYLRNLQVKQDWKLAVDEFVKHNKYFTWAQLLEYINYKNIEQPLSKNLSGYLKEELSFESKQRTIDSKRAIYWSTDKDLSDYLRNDCNLQRDRVQVYGKKDNWWFPANFEKSDLREALKSNAEG